MRDSLLTTVYIFSSKHIQIHDTYSLETLMDWFHHKRPTGIKIRQTYHTHRYFNDQGEEIMATPAGGTSVFQEIPTPAGTIFPAGTTFTWTVDDTADISLTPSADGTQVSATCIPNPTGTAYNLTCTSSYTPPGAPTPISATINVPIVQPPPPTPTGMQINQLS
jgi:hypothetical protein